MRGHEGCVEQFDAVLNSGYMFIDPESARNLELVQNNVTMKQNNCLFSTLNACQTPMGERLLRATILQPPCRELPGVISLLT